MARDSDKGNKRGGNVVIRREEVVEGGHHGGAWKVAYADFVTAMMAFFLLMWLLNATTEDQRKGLADYFSPTTALSRNTSGSGQPFGGHTPFDQGMLVSDRGAVQVTVGKAEVVPDAEDDDSDSPAKPRIHSKQPERDQAEADAAGDGSGSPVVGTAGGTAQATTRTSQPEAAPPAVQRANAVSGDRLADGKPASPNVANPQRAGATLKDGKPVADSPGDPSSAEAAEKRERQAFARAAEQIRAAVSGDPALAEIARQLTIDVTPEGLRVQILDEDRSPMFATGSAAPNERARTLLQKVAPVLTRLPEGISIAGHTDAAPYRGTDKSNWELSAERANATRRLLSEAGLPEARIRTVTGSADRDPLLPADPFAAANRRIAIVVLRAIRPAAATDPAPDPKPVH